MKANRISHQSLNLPLSASSSPASAGGATAVRPRPGRARGRPRQSAAGTASGPAPAAPRRPRRVGTGARAGGASSSRRKKSFRSLKARRVSLFFPSSFLSLSAFSLSLSISPSAMARLQALRSALRSLSQQSTAALRQGGVSAAASSAGANASSSSLSSSAAIARAAQQQVRASAFIVPLLRPFRFDRPLGESVLVITKKPLVVANWNRKLGVKGEKAFSMIVKDSERKKTIRPFSTATSTSQNLFSKKKYKQTVLPPPRGVRLRGSGGDRGRRRGALRPLCRDHRGDGDGGKEEEEEKS